MPHRIALLTSPTGAVIHDFVTVSTRRWRGRNILLIPTVVQGPPAAASIVHSLDLAANTPGVDVIVLARGGGSFEELAAFNDEAVARAIAASPVPVVSAVGHETDFTIADFVADLRAATPSAAAEIVVPDLQGVDEYLRNVEHRIQARVRNRLIASRRDLERLLAHPALRAPRTLIHERQQTVDLLTTRIFDRLRARLTAGKVRLENIEGRLAALDPRGVLLRGYSLVTDPSDGSLIASVHAARARELLAIQFADGSLLAQPVE